MKPTRTLIGTLLLGLCTVANAGAPDPAMPSDTAARLESHMAELQQQLDALKAELARLKSENADLTARKAAEEHPISAAADSADRGVARELSLWGYGEIEYLHPTSQPERTEFDLARAVFGIGYQFDELTVFNSEFEVEHAVASASDRGEFEVEQFYIDRQLGESTHLKAGLFLMPFGFLNEHHEPTSFYGVQRNFVETLVIPSTWREGGVALYGNSDNGINWDVGITTGPDLRLWDPNPAQPLYRSAFDLEASGAAPLQATHQELQFADARRLSEYVAGHYTGIPGLLVGGAFFTGTSAPPGDPSGLADPRITLWEGHARWTPGALDLSALIAEGRISRTEAFNAAHPGATNPLPARFHGGLAQAAYTVWQRGPLRVSPFIRWEHYDLGASYAGLSPGSTAVPAGIAADGLPWPSLNDRVWTIGTNFWLNPHVVVKADYQRFDRNADFNRFDLGLGLNF